MAGTQATPSSASPPHADAVNAAIVQTFDDGCGVHLEPYTNREGESDTGEVVVGVVSIGGAVAWTAFVALARESAVAAAESFVGARIPFEDDEMCDAIREVVDLFSVRVKAVLEQRDIRIAASMSTVLRTGSIDAFIAQAAPSETTCFRSKSGKVWVGAFAAA